MTLLLTELAALTGLPNVGFRRNYVDGVRARSSNGQFGFTFGMHDVLGVQNDLNDHFAIDIGASVMIPVLRLQLALLMGIARKCWRRR